MPRNPTILTGHSNLLILKRIAKPRQSNPPENRGIRNMLILLIKSKAPKPPFQGECILGDCSLSRLVLGRGFGSDYPPPCPIRALLGHTTLLTGIMMMSYTQLVYLCWALATAPQEVCPVIRAQPPVQQEQKGEGMNPYKRDLICRGPFFDYR